MTSDLLSIGASGLRAYRTALAATGDNIANAQTPGYARRSARIEEIAIGALPNPLYRNTTRFDGVDATAIVRATDAFRTGEARLTSAAHGRAEAISTWMGVAETALDDGETGVGSNLARVFANAETLAADPASRQPRVAFLGAIDAAASAIRSSADGLQRAATGVADAARQSVSALNADLATLNDINQSIRRAPPGTATFVELSDQRDAVLDRVAKTIDVDIAVDANGVTTLSRGGQPLPPGGLTLSVAGDGRLSLSGLAPTTGTLAGLVTASGTIADRRGDLEALVTDFATQINGWNANGRTAAGLPGAALIAGTQAATLALATDDPADIAAASPGGPANGNALALSGLRGGIEARWEMLATTQAQAAAAARTQESATASRRDSAAAARDAVEGVDLDAEAADLLRFQQAYEGAARVIQMAKETVDTILRLLS